LFEKPVPAPIAYAFARWLIRDWQDLGLVTEPEAFPKQQRLGNKTPFGSWARLVGRHHSMDFWTRAWTGRKWASGEEAIRVIVNTGGCDPGLIPGEVVLTPEPDDAVVDSAGSMTAETRTKTTRARTRQVRTQTETKPVEQVLQRLKRVTPCGNGWSARCPSHCDHSNSLSVAEGDDGRVLIFCFAGCAIDDIVEDLGLAMEDLFNRRRRRRPLRYSRKEAGK
jgi:hypothetical protein